MVQFHATDEPISTLLAALSLQGMGEALILEGSADSIAFEIYIEQILAPVVIWLKVRRNSPQ